MISFLLSLLLAATLGTSDTIERYLIEGRIDRVIEALELQTVESADSAEVLLLAALVSQSGEGAVSFLKEFINRSNTNSVMCDWARLRVGKYYLAQDLYTVAANQFREIPSGSAFGLEAAYLAARCYLLTQEVNSAEKILDSLAKHPPSDTADLFYYHWALLSLAQLKAYRNDNQGAEKILLRLLESGRQDDIVPLALIGLIELSEKIGRAEKAERYRRTYQQSYGELEPTSVTVWADSSGVPEGSAGQAETDRILGNRYYIEIGLFVRESNAREVADTYSKTGYQATVESIVKEGKRFYRVLVGGYASKNQARYVKERLEKASGEKYTLIVR